MNAPTIIADKRDALAELERSYVDDRLSSLFEPIQAEFPGWSVTVLVRRRRDLLTVTTDQLAPAIAALRRAQRREKRAS